ncbi:MAG: hypothetical protein KA457_07825 [Chitinophagales bacterium]|nr:hypothetical protein [Chitinophagales bacterium]
MQRTKYLIGFVFILFITNCKKDNNTETCINTEQRNAILQKLEHFKNDTTQYSAVERQFLNEVRIIANDLDDLTATVDTSVSIENIYNQINSKFVEHGELVEQKAMQFYHGSAAKTVLAKNAFVLMSYDALQRKYPEFMWTQLGIFAANEVRNGLVMALMMRQILINNNINLPFGNSTITQTFLETTEVLIDGQLNVLTDIGSLGILNRLIGANRIKTEAWLTPEAREGFRLQELAEQHVNANNCVEYMDLQTQAAIQFGAHEQVYILQPMWDNPTMKLFADLNKLAIQLFQHKIVFFGDIFIGTNKTTEANKGYFVRIPNNVNNLANAKQRVDVAINGFNTLNQLRKNSESSYWVDYSMIKIGYAHDTYQVPWIQ